MYLWIITIIILFISFTVDKNKTVDGLQKAYRKFFDIWSPLTAILIFVSFALYFLPSKTISGFLAGKNNYLALFIASVLGSISLMPGFIVFPLSGVLKQNNVPYMIISAFTTTLMMVGVVTFPIEKKYFGTKVSIIRNIFSFIIAIIVAVITGVYFKEI